MAPAADGRTMMIGGPVHPPSRSGGNVSERAYNELKRQILRGELSVGTVLREKDVSKQLGVSRTPLREAFNLLREDGLLDVGPRRQLVVSTISPARRREVFLLLTTLERLAVEGAIKDMALEEIDYLRLLLYRQRRATDAEDAEEWVDLDHEFHMAIAAGAKLPVLARFLDQLRLLVRLIAVGNARRPEQMRQLLAEHEKLVDALEDRDPEMAVKTISGHLARVEKELGD